MGQLIATNPQTSLSDAYDQACWMNPEIRALRIKEQHEAEAAAIQAQGGLSPPRFRQPSQRFADAGSDLGKRTSTNLARRARTSVRAGPHLTKQE